MADYTLNVLIDRYISLQAPPSAWLLMLPTSANMQKGSVLTVRLVNSVGTYLGAQMTAICTLIHSGEFYTVAPNNQLYYFKNPNKMAWIDYTASSTVVGWSSFTGKSIRYMVIGDTVFWNVQMIGTSNSTSVSFTLPIASFNTPASRNTLARVANNNSFSASPGMVNNVAGSNVFTGYLTTTSAVWTASNVKSIEASGFYQWR